VRSTTPSTDSRVWLKALLLVLIGAVIVVALFAGGDYLSLETLKSQRDALAQFAQAHLLVALAVAFLLFAAVVAFSLPGHLLLSLASGFVFGRVLGTALAVCAGTVGATALFLGARYLFADAARRRMGGVAAKINAGFTANAFHYLLFLRVVPVFPLVLVNLAMAFTSIPLRIFVGATFVGIVPASFVYANLGQALGSIESLSGLIAPETLIALGLLGAFALLPIAARALRAKSMRGD
jgi:uncharacterized membrane protein YdjX (TVP38/TMEM64 family)